jgi:hypothetical protein
VDDTLESNVFHCEFIDKRDKLHLRPAIDHVVARIWLIDMFDHIGKIRLSQTLFAQIFYFHANPIHKTKSDSLFSPLHFIIKSQEKIAKVVARIVRFLKNLSARVVGFL